MTANGIEHPDFQNSKELARRDEETIKQKKSPGTGEIQGEEGKRCLLLSNRGTDEKLRNSQKGI